MPKKPPYTVHNLRNMVLVSELASSLNLHRATMARWLKDYNIPTYKILHNGRVLVELVSTKYVPELTELANTRSDLYKQRSREYLAKRRESA